MHFQTLTLREENGVLYVTLDNPPINLMNGQMVGELMQVGGMLMQRRDLKVVVVDSADPDFWIAHFDVTELEASLKNPATQSKYPDINAVQSLGLIWQNVPQITIGKVKGRARGGGLEFLLSLDMRFATEGSLFCNPEAGAGFLAAGGGCTRLMMMAGPARALEILLSRRDFTGVEFERWNLVNKALPAGEIDAYVADLVGRIASLPPEIIAMHRAVLDKVVTPFVDAMFAGMAAENVGFHAGIASGAIAREAKLMIELGQTREHELDLPRTIQALAAGR
ncbi:enoyl-CoA hydratase/isomerase family protein [Azospirillum sp.]|uniref:enoyl-CoA hydratase/isomerase family protein n=1 Tax=Azospirillum sp. TaxID=34012 RepID=UPI0026156B64|nr:enoyl-CoA hydratase/isomerase family protein [Azospirillum sp.]